VQQLGNIRAGAELSELYQNESSADVKKRIIQALLVSGNADKLMELARTEKDQDLRRTAIRNLGVLAQRPQQNDAAKTTDALKAIYAADSSPEIRREVINALSMQRNATSLIALARAEKDPAMKREIVQRLASMKSKEAADYMLELLK
jgi:hypothetical protein